MKANIIVYLGMSLILSSCLNIRTNLYKDSYRAVDTKEEIPKNAVTQKDNARKAWQAGKGCYKQTVSQNGTKDIQLSGCPKSNFYVSDHEEKAIAILEIDEQGKYISEQNANFVLENIKAEYENATLKPIIAIYVHGWNHNAMEYDNNWYVPQRFPWQDKDNKGGDLQKFGRAIHNLYYSQSKIIEARRAGSDAASEGRKVIGVYVAWRGKVFPKPINYATFWDRKSVSEEIGRGDLMRFLLKLESIVKPNKSDNNQNSILIAMGHSFGASALYNALSPILLSRFYQSIEEQKYAKSASGAELVNPSKPVPLRGYGDLVVLVNPAIEATRFMALREAVWRTAGNDQSIFENNTKPLFISIGGSADKATKLAFKGGRYLNTFFENYRKVNLADGNSATKTFNVSEKELDITSVGNYPPFYTHWVTRVGEFYNSSKINTDSKTSYKTSAQIVMDNNGSPDLFLEKACGLDPKKTYTPLNTNNLIFPRIKDPDYQPSPLLIANYFVSVDVKDGKYLRGEDWPIGEPTNKTTKAESTTWPQNPYWFVRASKNVIGNHTDIWNREVGCLILDTLVRSNVAKDGAPSR